VKLSDIETPSSKIRSVLVKRERNNVSVLITTTRTIIISLSLVYFTTPEGTTSKYNYSNPWSTDSSVLNETTLTIVESTNPNCFLND
jgi:hypothetical protein